MASDEILGQLKSKLGRPVAQGFGKCGAITRHSASVRSVWYRVTGRLCCCRVVGVHMANSPQVPKEYAISFRANLSGWSFLTGSPAAIRDVTRRYGVVASKNINGDVDHTFLTSIVDQSGVLRVQYAGVRFDPGEFKRDLVSLLRER